MANIPDANEYYLHLKRNFDSDSNEIYQKAYDTAVKFRDLEINLYWKRSTYFWAFIALAFTGFFTLSRSAEEGLYLTRIIICGIGLVFSIAWFLINKGSKYWQENWETHIALLERKVTGPLYMTILESDKKNMYCIDRAYPFSVSKINSVISSFIVLLWIFLLLYTTLNYLGSLNINGLSNDSNLFLIFLSLFPLKDFFIFAPFYIFLMLFPPIIISAIVYLLNTFTEINIPSKRHIMGSTIAFTEIQKDDISKSKMEKRF